MSDCLLPLTSRIYMLLQRSESSLSDAYTCFVFTGNRELNLSFCVVCVQVDIGHQPSSGRDRLLCELPLRAGCEDAREGGYAGYFSCEQEFKPRIFLTHASCVSCFPPLQGVVQSAPHGFPPLCLQPFDQHGSVCEVKECLTLSVLICLTNMRFLCFCFFFSF